jgi:hypothetical protein
MNIQRDVFGTEILMGHNIVCSGANCRDELLLFVMEVTNVYDDHITAIQLNGEDIGWEFPIFKTELSVAILRNIYKDAKLREGQVTH